MNAIHGCTAGCGYCYAWRMAYRLRGRCGYPKRNPFKPTFTPSQLKKLDCKKPTRFFISSMGDMFDPQVKQEWREVVYRKAWDNNRHEYLILTKQPQNITHDDIQMMNRHGITFWLGVSITSKSDLWRLKEIKDKRSDGIYPKLFISFEPLLEEMDELNLNGIDWIIIGGQSGPQKFYPKKEWVDNIKRQAKVAGIPVYLKKNLNK